MTTSATEREMMTLGDVVRTRRQATGQTGARLAKTLGISAQHLSDIEHDRRTPSRGMRLMLAAALGCSSDYLDYLACAVPITIRRSLTGTDAQITAAWDAFRRTLEQEQST